MMAADGLLVRLRLTGGIVEAGVARALADMAERFGNGLFDLSARANLQMRGVPERHLPLLHEALRAGGLLDTDAAGEAVRNFIASPLAGLHDGPDIRPVVAALEHRLVEDTSLHALPGKFGWLVDDGSDPTLDAVDVDVRFDWDADRAKFAVALGGTRDTALPAGVCEAGCLSDVAAAIGHRFIAQAVAVDTRRMRLLRKHLGDAGMVEAFGLAGGPRPVQAHRTASEVVGTRTLSGVRTLGLGAPFGRLDADMLRAAADMAERDAAGELRLTPWRAILVPNLRRAPSGPLERFILDPADPRLRIAACTGMNGCARGSTPTHADAEALAASLARSAWAGTLHVSGCEKGCAKPGVSSLTMVGRAGRYDLVRNGRAGDPPCATGLDLAGCRDALATLEEPA